MVQYIAQNENVTRRVIQQNKKQREAEKRTVSRMLAGFRSPWQMRRPCMYAMPSATPRSTAMIGCHRRGIVVKMPRTIASRSVPPLQNSCKRNARSERSQG